MEVYIGTIMAFGFNFAPVGWALCNGQTLSIQANAALFSLIGTSFGGNGTTNFNLPDLQGRICLGQGTGAGLPTYVMGEFAGVTDVTLQIGNLPAHTHIATVAPLTIQASSIAGTTTSPAGANLAGAYQGAPARGGGLYVASGSAGTLSALAANTVSGGGVTNAPTGNNLPLNVQSPYLTVNYCICLQGLFPSRS